MIKGFTRKFRQLEFLSAEEEDEIHGGALYVLDSRLSKFNRSIQCGLRTAIS